MKQERKPDEFARRRAIRQKRIRKRRRRIALLTVLFLFAAVFVILSFTVLFPIKSITVKGNSRYTHQQIIESSGVDEGDNILAVSSGKCEKKLKKTLPFIDSVKFERNLSGKLVISVKDATEYLVYNTNGKYFTVSKSGWVLNSYDSLPEGLLEIRTKDIKPQIGSAVSFEKEASEELIESIKQFAKDNSLKLNRIDITDKVNIEIKTEDRFSVNFGTENNLEKKFKHLSGIIKSIGSDKKGKINLSMWTETKTEGTFVEVNPDE